MAVQMANGNGAGNAMYGVDAQKNVDFNTVFSAQDFVDPINGKFMTTPVQAIPCKHYFDEHSLNTWYRIHGQKICWVCRAPVEFYTPSTFLADKINRIKSQAEGQGRIVQNGLNNPIPPLANQGAVPQPQRIPQLPPLQQQAQPQQQQLQLQQQQQQQLQLQQQQFLQQQRLPQPPQVAKPQPVKRTLLDDMEKASEGQQIPLFGQPAVQNIVSAKTEQAFNLLVKKIPSLNVFKQRLNADKGIAKCKDEAGNSLYHHVVRTVSRSAGAYFKALSENGGDINSTNNEGNTPLRVAIVLGKKKTTEELLAQKARKDIVGRDNVPLRDLPNVKQKSWSTIRNQLAKR